MMFVMFSCAVERCRRTLTTRQMYPVVLVLASVMTESIKNGLIVLLGLFARLQVTGSCRQWFGTQSSKSSVGNVLNKFWVAIRR